MKALKRLVPDKYLGKFINQQISLHPVIRNAKEASAVMKYAFIVLQFNVLTRLYLLKNFR